MTAICTGGGTSSVKPGVQNNIVYLSGGVEALALVPGLEWLTLVAIGGGLLAYSLPQICATDPPGWPTFTTDDKIALLVGALHPGWTAAQAKLSDAIQTAIWYQFCKCDAGTQPTQPTPPTDPGGTQLVGPQQPAATLCGTWLSAPTVCSSDLATSDLFSSVLPPPQPGPPACPAGATMVRFTLKNIVTGIHPDSIDFTYSYFTDLTTQHTPPFTHTLASGGTFVQDFVLPPGVTGFGAICARHTNGSNNSNLAQMQIDVYCGGFPGQPTAPCCPPDGISAAILSQILAQVNLIQRQSVPFAYTPSTTHTGLSGSGVISISGLIGAKVSITTLPASLGRSGTTPLEIFDAGFITFGTADGYPTSIRLEHNPQLMLPARCSAYTDLAYDLHPGVVVTITELLREAS